MEDQFLVRQVLAGNTNAFRFLVLRHQKPIFRYLRSFGLPDAQVEEIAQDAFIKAYRSLSLYEPGKSQFKTWLFVIARNSALNAISKHSYSSEVLTDEEPDSMETATPLSVLEQTALKERIHRCLDELPMPFRNVIALFHFSEMTLEEISEIEKCSLGTVKSRLHRAKALLREIVLKTYGTESL